MNPDVKKQSLRIGVDGREISVNRPGGLRSYVESVVWSLSTASSSHDINVYLDRPFDCGAWGQGARWQVCGPAQLAIREQISLARLFRSEPLDIVHFPANTAPLICKLPYVLTLHDVFCVERSITDILREGNMHAKAISMYARVIPTFAARRSRRVITVSEFSAGEITRRMGIGRDRIDVIHQALQARFRRTNSSELRCKILSDMGVNSFILVLGSFEPKKNLGRALAAVASVQAKDPSVGLALTVSSSENLRRWLERNRLTLPPRTAVLENVSDSEIVGLYSAADCFLFPSVREGFGLPVVEAMACGCPVVTSDTSSLPEAAGGAALLADPLRTDDIALQLQRVLGDNALSDDLVQRGIERAELMSPAHTASSLIDAYTRALDAKK